MSAEHVGGAGGTAGKRGTGDTVADGDIGMAVPHWDEISSRPSEKRGFSVKCSKSGDAGNAMFSGGHGAKVALAGDVGKLAEGLVRAVSRDAVHEKLEKVGDGYPESRSSWIGDRKESSCSSCSFTLSEKESMRRRRIGPERFGSGRDSF